MYIILISMYVCMQCVHVYIYIAILVMYELGDATKWLLMCEWKGELPLRDQG